MWWPLTLTYIFKVIRPWFWKRVRSVTFSVLDRLYFWLRIQYDSIVLVIMRRRGYPQNAGVLIVLVVNWSFRKKEWNLKKNVIIISISFIWKGRLQHVSHFVWGSVCQCLFESINKSCVFASYILQLLLKTLQYPLRKIFTWILAAIIVSLVYFLLTGTLFNVIKHSCARLAYF